MENRPPRRTGWAQRSFAHWMLGGVMGLIALVVAIPVVVEALTPVFAKSAEQWVNLGSASSRKTTSRQAGRAGVGGGAHAVQLHPDRSRGQTPGRRLCLPAVHRGKVFVLHPVAHLHAPGV